MQRSNWNSHPNPADVAWSCEVKEPTYLFLSEAFHQSISVL
jgi:hypothetical protein